MVKSIIIVGSGTAGLIAGLLLKSWYSDWSITIISSTKIEIIGVGEGSTEHWRGFMDSANISFKDIFTNTDATMKAGIKFVNWNGDNNYYFHALHTAFTSTLPSTIPGFLLKKSLDNEKLWPEHIDNSLHHYPFEDSVNQFHFDTFKLNSFFVDLAKKRSIEFIDDKIVDTTLDENGYIENIVGEKNNYIADFFIDASGFTKILTKKMNLKWIDCSKFLPMNRAITFASPLPKKIPSYTESIAMSSGWAWKIPTQERVGNGYVFSSDFLSNNNAIEEIESFYQKKNLEINKSINFSAGFIDKFWNKNCLSIGLSSSFVEPLEATSIGTTIQQMFAFNNLINFYQKNDEVAPNNYNKIFNEVLWNIIDFIQLHYITKREDSDFWRTIKNEIQLTEFNLKYLDLFKNTGPANFLFDSRWNLFSDHNYFQIMNGLDMFNKKNLKNIYNNQSDTQKAAIDFTIQDYNSWASKMFFESHNFAIYYFKNAET